MNPLPSWLAPILQGLLLSRDSLHHALLFSGPEGIGKEWLARALAAALLCDQADRFRPACGQCSACRWLSQDSHPDVRLVRPSADEAPGDGDESGATRPGKASRDIRIEQVRALAGFVEVASHRGGEKIILITPADAMNAAAANALLKTLEEPPPRTRFLLVSSRVSRLPATVRSRCRRVPVPKPSGDEALAWVVGQARVEPDRARAWLSFCGGAPRRALELGATDQAAVHRDLIEAFSSADRESLSAAADRLQAHEPRAWLPVLQAWVVDLARSTTGASPRYFPAESRRLQDLGGRADGERLLDFEQWLQKMQRLVSHPLNARLVAEDTLSRYRAIFRRRARAA